MAKKEVKLARPFAVVCASRTEHYHTPEAAARAAATLDKKGSPQCEGPHRVVRLVAYEVEPEPVEGPSGRRYRMKGGKVEAWGDGVGWWQTATVLVEDTLTVAALMKGVTE